MRFQQLKKGMALFFAIFIFASSLFSPIKAEAHDTFFLQVLIDEGTYQYQGNVIDDKLSGSEAKHVEQSTGIWHWKFRNGGVHMSSSSDPKSDDYKDNLWGNNDPEFEAPFSFPSAELGEGWGGKKKNDANKNDAERAYIIRDTLMPGLNDALFILNGSKPYKNMDTLVKRASALTAVKRNGAFQDFTVGKQTYKVKFGTNTKSGRASYAKPLTNYQKKTMGIIDGDFMTIKTPDGEEFEFVYRMPKGYSSKDGYTNKWDNKVYDSQYKQVDDIDYITWHILVFQGNYALFNKGWTMTQAHEIVGASEIEEFFVSLIQSALNGLRNLLGLYSINELIYNEGVRGSSAWVHGTMPEAWHDNVVKYHFVFQGLAWTLISLAIVKSLIQRNLATINPGMRISLMEQIQNLLVTGFILSAIFPIIAMFMYLNVKVVDVFGSITADFGDFAGLNNYSNMIAGMILQVFYFIVTLYLNFVYIMRSITLAILIAMAPLFVVTIAFGGAWKQLFGVWMKELLANIFLQSFHAFILGFFITTTASSRGIEQMVIAFAMIPLTEFFRSLVMGQAGGVGHKLGIGATSAALSMGTQALGLAGKGGKAVAGKVAGSGNAEGADGMSMDSRDAMSRGDSSAMGSSPQIKSMNQQKGHNVDSVRAMKDKGTPLDVFTKGSDADKEMFKAPEMSGLQAGFKDAWENLKPNSSKDAVIGGMSAIAGSAKGLAQMGVGAGMMLALGGSDPYMAGRGIDMMSDGAKNIKGVAGKGSASIGQAVSSVKAGYELDKEPQFKTPGGQSQMSSEAMYYEPTANGSISMILLA